MKKVEFLDIILTFISYFIIFSHKCQDARAEKDRLLQYLASCTVLPNLAYTIEKYIDAGSVLYICYEADGGDVLHGKAGKFVG